MLRTVFCLIQEFAKDDVINIGPIANVWHHCHTSLLFSEFLPWNSDCRSDSLSRKLMTLLSSSHSCAVPTRHFHSQQSQSVPVPRFVRTESSSKNGNDAVINKTKIRMAPLEKNIRMSCVKQFRRKSVGIYCESQTEAKKSWNNMVWMALQILCLVEKNRW